MRTLPSLVQLEDGHEGLGGELDGAQGAHLLLAFLLLFQQLLLPADVAAVALGQHVLPHGLDGLAGDDLAADGRLDGDLEELAGDVLLQLFADLPGAAVGLVPVDDEGQGVHLLAVEQQIDLDQVGSAVVQELVVQGGVAFGPGLQGVKEVIDNFVQGHVIMDLDQVGVEILHVFELAPALLAHGHDVADVVRGGDDGDLDERLPLLRDDGGVGVVVGVVHADLRAVGLGHFVNDVGQGGDEVQVELPLQALLNDLHVEHPQKAAAEAEAQGGGGLRLEGQGGVVELELFQGIPQVGVLGAVFGVNAAVDHAPGRAIAGQGLVSGVFHGGDGVAHLGVLDVLDGGGEIADLAGGEALARLQFGGQQMADLHQAVLGAGGHHLHGLVQGQRAFHDAEVDDDTTVGVILAVEDQGLEGGLGVAGGGGDVMHHVLQDGLNIGAHLGGDLRGVGGLQADDVLHLFLGQGGVGGGQVDLVDDGANFEIMLHGQIGVGQGLGLHALGGVDHENGPLAGGQGAGDLVVKVHVARRVDEVQGVGLAVQSVVLDGDGAGLDGDAALAL